MGFVSLFNLFKFIQREQETMEVHCTEQIYGPSIVHFNSLVIQVFLYNVLSGRFLPQPRLYADLYYINTHMEEQEIHIGFTASTYTYLLVVSFRIALGGWRYFVPSPNPFFPNSFRKFSTVPHAPLFIPLDKIRVRLTRESRLTT